MDKNGKISLSNFITGQANSPYEGFATMVGCEVFETPGILKIAPATVLNELAVTGLPIKKLSDPYGSNWVLTDDGKLYKNGILIESGLSNAWDICIFHDYVIIRYGSGNGVLSAYGPLASGLAAFRGSFVSGLDFLYYGKLLVGTVEDVNGAVYVGNGANIGTLKQVAGKVFDPTDSSTYSFVADAYTINNGFCVTLAEIGDLLAIGTQQGSSWADRGNYRSADIHYWDRSSAKADSIVHLKECGIQALIGKDNRIYAVAGTRGNVYETDTTNYTKIRRIPWNNNRIFNTSMAVYPNAIDFNQNGNLLIGTSTGTDSYGAGGSNSKHGVYEVSIQPIENRYPAVLKNIISTGDYGATQSMAIGMIWSGPSDTISIGWRDGSAFGLDDTDFRVYSGYKAFFESGIIYIAPRNARRTLQNIEFKIGKPLIDGQGIKLYGRKNLIGTYKLIATFDFVTLGAVISTHQSAIFSDLELVEFKVMLDQDPAAEIGSNIELLDISLW